MHFEMAMRRGPRTPDERPAIPDSCHWQCATRDLDLMRILTSGSAAAFPSTSSLRSRTLRIAANWDSKSGSRTDLPISWSVIAPTSTPAELHEYSRYSLAGVVEAWGSVVGLGLPFFVHDVLGIRDLGYFAPHSRSEESATKPAQIVSGLHIFTSWRSIRLLTNACLGSEMIHQSYASMTRYHA